MRGHDRVQVSHSLSVCGGRIRITVHINYVPVAEWQPQKVDTPAFHLDKVVFNDPGFKPVGHRFRLVVKQVTKRILAVDFLHAVWNEKLLV
jgi:hypothetical protein